MLRNSRRRALLALLTAALLAPAVPALAHPAVPLDPTLPTDLTWSATDNVEHLGRFPEHTGTAGGARSADGKRFYLTDPRGVYVYDTTDAAKPDLLGSLPLFQQQTGAALSQEDVDTNGKVLLVDGAATPVGSAKLHVVDVSNPRALKVLSTVPVTDHTWTCVTGRDATGAQNSCAYAYGRTGHVVDLTNPAKAKVLPTTWRKAVGYGDRKNDPYTHDLTEIRPGLVMSAGSTAILMDTRNPVRPVRLTAIEQPDRFPSLGYHSVEWARDGRDRWLVLGTEIAPDGALNAAGSDCQGDSSVIETWDASSVLRALKAYEKGAPVSVFRKATFTKVDAYDAAGRGLFLDGQAPGHVLYCAHWMEQHPAFADGGLLAVSYYDRGTRFVQIGRDGRMRETGWIVPAEGYSGSAQWVTKDVVYVMDYRRGLEVVRLTGSPATGVRRSAADVVSADSTFDLVAAYGLHDEPGAPVGVLALGGAALVLMLVQAERVARRRARRQA